MRRVGGGRFVRLDMNVLGVTGHSMAKPLVIVESPAKAKTLGRFLGNEYRVEASYGHIRDLPESAAEVPEGDQGEGMGPPRRRRRQRLHAVLRRPRATSGSRSRTSRPR